MGSRKPAIPVIAIILLFFSCAHLTDTQTPDSSVPITIALVQFQASDDLYLEGGQFETRVRQIVENCFAKDKPGLVIFPEYTSVFLALSPFSDEVRGKKTSAEAFPAILASPRATGVRDFKSLFMKESDFVEARMKRVFGDLARRFRTTIVAGSYFAAEGENLKNRAVVFGPDGDVIYTQDKVFLTPIESDVFKITPGDIEKAEGFVAAGRRAVLTICRDSLESVWETHYNSTRFAGTNLWIDIKANGEVYTYAVQESFPQFMPGRLARTRIPFGVTVCLTGSFLEFFWEGESSVIRNQGGSLEVLEKSFSATSPQIIITTLQ